MYLVNTVVMVISEGVGVLELALIIPLIAIIIFPIQNGTSTSTSMRHKKSDEVE